MCFFDPPPQPQAAAAPVQNNEPVPTMKSPEDQNKDSTGSVRSAANARRQLRMDIPTGSAGSTGAGLNVPM
jgi:hypothetical protein